MQTEKQIKADAVNEFVCSMIGALEAGFIDTPNCNLAQIHRVAQHHIKDSYDIEIPHLTEQWGEDVAKLCGFSVRGVTGKDSLLNVEISDDALKIKIGTEVLFAACGQGRSYGLGDVTITDKELFLSELVRELKTESEDGSTPIHLMLDQAVTDALENGAEGVCYDD